MKPLIPQKDIYSVDRLNAEVRSVLETSFPLIWVEGEISNLSTPRSGHSYFSLKDAHAQVRCALFRGKRQLLRFQPADGDKVLMRARISFYEARGDFQLIVEHMQPAGEGDLLRAFEELKQKLDKEGLFDTNRKQNLPLFPQCIGLITSPTGAAVRDILHILKRRFPLLPVIIYPTAVQGDKAPMELIDALNVAQQRNECDVLIITRGGGSLEDLAAFNDEQLARTISQSSIPVVSAVGHEVDFSIADFVADRRAPTPSAAAEITAPEQQEIEHKIQQYSARLSRSIEQQLRTEQQHLEHLNHKLRLLHPSGKLQQQQQRLDGLEHRLHTKIQQQLDNQQQSLNNLNIRISGMSPQQSIAQMKQKLEHLQQRVMQFWQMGLQQKQSRFSIAARELNTLSPLQTLGRGYSITSLVESGTIVTDAQKVQIGSEINTRLEKGSLLSVIKKVEF